MSAEFFVVNLMGVRLHMKELHPKQLHPKQYIPYRLSERVQFSAGIIMS